MIWIGIKRVSLLVLLGLFVTGACDKEYPPSGTACWKKDSVDFYLNRQANMLTETVVRQTFQHWAEKTHFSFVYKGRNGAGLKKDGKNTVSFLIRWPAGIPINKLAYCKNWYDDEGHIIESDIIFNMQIAVFTTLKTNRPDSYYLEGVLTHEIGHMIGLDHIKSAVSLMKQQSSVEESFFKGKIDELTLRSYEKLYARHRRRDPDLI